MFEFFHFVATSSDSPLLCPGVALSLCGGSFRALYLLSCPTATSATREGDITGRLDWAIQGGINPEVNTGFDMELWAILLARLFSHRSTALGPVLRAYSYYAPQLYFNSIFPLTRRNLWLSSVVKPFRQHHRYPRC